MIRKITLIVFAAIWQLQAIAQVPAIHVSSNMKGEVIRISESHTFSDLSISIGHDIIGEDLSVAITEDKKKADFVVVGNSKRATVSYRVDNTEPFPDYIVHYGGRDIMAIPDYEIKMVRSEFYAGILIYTEKVTLSEQEVIACLLPMIRKKIGK